MNQPVRSQTTTADTITKARLRRILIVENEASLALIIQMGLETLPNCEVLTALSGEQALQRAKKQPLDLLITDYCMPGINGITLAAQIRRLSPETAIIMITTKGSEEVRQQAAGLSIHSILDKPVALADLRWVVSEALEERPRQ